MTNPLKGYRIAVLAVDGFEQAELTNPKRELTEAGAEVHVVSAALGTIHAYNQLDKGGAVEVDATFDNARPEDYDAVVLPGGVVNSDAIRVIPQAQAFVRAIDMAHKPVAAICDGGWLAILAGIVKGHRMASWPGLRDDICEAGGRWVDARVVEDGNLISTGRLDELPELNKKLIAQLYMCGEPR